MIQRGLAWCQDTVVPLFKKIFHSQPQNYRAVSLTSVVEKLFEGLIKEKIQTSSEIMLCICASMLSCQTKLISFELSRDLDSGMADDVLYLRLKAKAFDTVPHRWLLVKLRNVGLGHSICTWMQNWLKEIRELW